MPNLSEPHDAVIFVSASVCPFEDIAAMQSLKLDVASDDAIPNLFSGVTSPFSYLFSPLYSCPSGDRVGLKVFPLDAQKRKCPIKGIRAVQSSISLASTHICPCSPSFSNWSAKCSNGRRMQSSRCGESASKFCRNCLRDLCGLLGTAR